MIKEDILITIILILFALVMFLGMIGDEDKFNKRTYCYAFIACVVAAAAIVIAGMLI